MSLVVRQVTLNDAEGITNVLNPIIIEGDPPQQFWTPS